LSNFQISSAVVKHCFSCIALVTKIFTHIKVKEIEISNVFSQTNHVQIYVNHKTEVTSYMLLIDSGVLVDRFNNSSRCTVYCRLIHARVL